MTGPARRASAAWKVLTGTGTAATAGLGLLVFVCVLVAVAAPRQSLGLRTRALQHSFAAVPALATSVQGTVDYNTYDLAFNGPFGATDLADTQSQLAANLGRQRLSLAGRAADWSGLTVAPAVVSGAARSAYYGPTPPLVEVLYRDALARHATLLAGRLPTTARTTAAHADFQVAVTRATAARFGLRPGARLAFGPGVTLTVTGILVPRQRSAAFWTADAAAPAPTFHPSGLRQPGYWIGAVFVGGPELAALQQVFDHGVIQLYWNFPLDLRRVNADQADTLGGQLSSVNIQSGEVFVGPNRQPTSIVMASGLAPLLAAFVQQDRAIGRVLSLLSVSLAVVGAVVIILAARLLAEHRRDEFAVMRARGASRRQVARLALQASLVIAVPAAAAGAALAVGLTAGDSDPLGWWLAGLILLVAVAWPALLAFRSNAVGSSGRRPDARASRRDAARRLVAEATLIAVAVGGLVVLTRQGLSASGHSDLYLSALPVLIAIPDAIVIMRCYPVVIRLLLRLAGRRPGVTAFVGLARSARTPASAVLPAFALVLSLVVVAFGAMVNAAVARGEVAVSWQRTGADAVIDASGSPSQLTPAVLQRIRAVPGVERTAGVFVTNGIMSGGQVTGVVVVDPASYAALIAATPLPAFPAAKLAQPGRPGSAVPVLGSGFAIAAAGRGATTLQTGLSKLTVRIVGTTPSIPGASGAYIVLPAWALRPAPPAPTTLLVVGPHVDGRALPATVRPALPGAIVTLRSQVLAGLTGAPLPHGAHSAFAEGAVVAAGFSLLILLITLLLSARSREFTLARLRVMGLGQGQARRLAAVETLPQVLAAVVGGVLSAWLLAWLVGPAIDLSAFTSSGAGAAIRVEPLALAIAAGALFGLALLALAGQVVIADRRGRARALRVAE